MSSERIRMELDAYERRQAAGTPLHDDESHLIHRIAQIVNYRTDVTPTPMPVVGDDEGVDPKNITAFDVALANHDKLPNCNYHTCEFIYDEDDEFHEDDPVDTEYASLRCFSCGTNLTNCDWIHAASSLMTMQPDQEPEEDGTAFFFAEDNGDTEHHGVPFCECPNCHRYQKMGADYEWI
jgi:hypothetical protein